MATEDQEPDDRLITIQKILDKRGSTLMSELLDIAKYTDNVEKAHKWVENPLCLLFRESSPHIFQGIRVRNLERPFIAISWTWTPSKHESSHSGNYQVKHSLTGHVAEIDIRSCILDRVTKYLRSPGKEVFWIDKICINQDNPKEKQEAMNSMDLIYRLSRKSIALLSTPIMSQNSLNILVRLVAGGFSTSTGDHYRLRRDVSWTMIRKVIRLLCRITNDLWWTRGWTFQEEYVAGVNMDILLPLGPGVESIPGSGDIPGEYCVSATDFRTQATVFLEACMGRSNIIRQQAGRSWQFFKGKCSEICKVVAKYNIILTEPMSVRIHADVGRRNITRPWDSLAIIANSCGYETRLNRIALLEKKQSLSLCLLAQYLLNGEITSSGWQRKGFLDFPLVDLLEKVTLSSCPIPLTPRRLTFLKHCRFNTVGLCELGRSTKGLLWELKPEDRLYTSTFNLPKMSESRREHLKHSPWESMELNTLGLELEQNHRDVAEQLSRYVQGRHIGRTWGGSEYMDLMAWDLVQAIKQGHVLQIGYLKNLGAGSIFIPGTKDIERPIYVFSTWSSGQMREFELDNYVSIEVSMGQDGVLSPVEWMRGLLFLRQTQEHSLVVRSF